MWQGDTAKSGSGEFKFGFTRGLLSLGLRYVLY